MDNISYIPEGWSMPDDLARRINELMSKKRNSTPLDDLLYGLYLIVNQIADFGRSDDPPELRSTNVTVNWEE
jgi:hypothetical protein